MSAQQTTYQLELSTPSQPGFISDTGPKRIKPYRNDNAGALPFGVLLCRSSNADLQGADLPSTSKQILGVNSFSQRFENSNGVPTKEMCDIAEQAEVLVSVSEAVTPESPVRVIIATGVFCTTADSSTHTTAKLEGAKFIGSTAGAGVCKALVNLPGLVELVAD